MGEKVSTTTYNPKTRERTIEYHKLGEKLPASESSAISTAKIREEFGQGFVFTDKQYIDFLEMVIREQNEGRSGA